MEKLLYKTIDEYAEFEIPKIKWSRFIGNIFHCENKEDTEHFIHEIEKKYPDASHHCFAYRYEVQMNLDIFGNAVYASKHNKVSDAGEPTNTAGKPIMSMIEKYELHNILVVVTRFFGGTLLGVGGLIQAYGEAAKQVIEHADIIEAEIMKTLKFNFDFDLIPIVRNICNKYSAKIIEERYNEDIWIHLIINAWLMNDFSKELKNESKGSIIINR